MTIRTRSKQLHCTFGYGSNPIQYINGPATVESITDSNPGPGSCYHIKYEPFTGYCGYGGGQHHYGKNMTTQWCGSGLTPPMLDRIKLMQYDLNWNKLPTSSQFGLLQFIAELDDTLLMFSKKFLSKLSYGAITWGVLPFVSEMKAFLDALERIFRRYSSDNSAYFYEDQISESMVDEYISSGVRWRSSVDVKVRHTGRVHMPTPDILQFFDLIGFQPSLSTVWDLIPLSFALDWFIPIGSYLDNLKHSEGWVSQIYFNGWTTTSLSVTIVPIDVPSDPNWKPAGTYKYTSFERVAQGRILNDVTYKPKVKFSLPDFMELFNTLYLANTILNKK